MFNPPFYATVGNRLHNSSTLLPAEHTSGQTLQKKWMANQRQPRTPFTAVTSSATSVYHAHLTPVVQYITAVPAAQIYIFFTVADSVNDACCILSSLHISYKDVVVVVGRQQLANKKGDEPTVTKDTIQQYNSRAASVLADFRAFFSCVFVFAICSL